MQIRGLFGGAIEAPVFDSFLDASTIRQIPDHQEVFVDVNTQQSLIYELLDQVGATEKKVAEHHFRQLADDNEAEDCNILSVDTLNPQEVSPLLPQDTSEIYVLQGQQKIAKFNETNAFNTVEIVMAVVRLTNVKTDFVISVNAPIKLAQASSEQKSVNDTSAVTIDSVRQEMLTVLKGLQIKC
ncbi:hypothetical protein [Parasitella parasitica]|uniref:Mog1p/PsbP-like protein n=1 Tax=Parasitella parasitica TaxID=35722 RepID=A0A0B7NA36_9FUNG|nr:hypothetical protein [Parasitella parasitica]